jgi:hypothetical protein
MACAQCAAFISAYNTASEHYAEAVDKFHKMASNGQFKDPTYSKLKREVEQTRIVCDTGRAALRVHREGHQRP